MDSREIAPAAMAGLTDMQRDFVQNYAIRNMSQTDAAETAGFANPRQEGWRLLQLPHVRAAIWAARETIIQTDLAQLGLKTIKSLMEEPDTPANVKFQAAKFSVELAGHGQRDADKGQEKNLSEMSTDELAEFVRRGKDALDSRLENMPRVAPVLTLNAQYNAQG